MKWARIPLEGILQRAIVFCLVFGLLPALCPAKGPNPKQDEQTAAQVRSLVREARHLFDLARRDEAEKKVREALALDPADSEAKRLLGSIELSRERARRREIRRKIEEASRLVRAGDYAKAENLLASVVKEAPRNADAQKLLARVREHLRAAKGFDPLDPAEEKQARIRELIAQGMAAYRKNDIETAVARWREVLLLDPSNRRASAFLKEVKPEYDRLQAEKRRRRQAEQAEEQARRKLDEKITIEVKEGTKLRDFLNTLSFVSGINFVVVQGADATVAAKFEDKPLREILDAVLLPNGLNWTQKGDIVTIAPDLRPRVFLLDSDTFLKVKRLYETNELQKLLWSSENPPTRGVELQLDDSRSAVILKDSPSNIAKLESLLAQLRRAPAPKLTTRIYSVRSDLADNVKTLVEAMLKSESKTPFESQRRVIVAKHEGGAELIVKGTEDNVRKVEQLLSDRNFLKRLSEEDIEVYTVNLTPRDIFKANPEQVETFARNIKEVVETMLYHDKGMAQARAEGRRLWFDPATLQLTITDSPSNIRKVAEFIQSLPQLEPKRRSKIIFLEYANAGDLASQIEEILGIGPGVAAGGAAAGNEATFTLRVEDERTFRDLNVRLTRVNENDPIDDNDDSCELVVRTSTAQSSDLTIDEYHSETFEDYEILVEDVKPSPTPGEGRVKIRVTYRPALGTGAGY